MERIIEFINSNLIVTLTTSIITSIISVLISCKNTKSTKKIESELSKKLYISSKWADMEFKVFYELNKNCGEVFRLMQKLYPIYLTEFQINNIEDPSFNDLALSIKNLEIEINNSQMFIPDEIFKLYEELLNDAIEFYNNADKDKLCWNNTTEDRIRKNELKDIAYESSENFRENWRTVNLEIRKYLSNEKI